MLRSNGKWGVFVPCAILHSSGFAKMEILEEIIVFILCPSLLSSLRALNIISLLQEEVDEDQSAQTSSFIWSALKSNGLCSSLKA